MLNHALKIMSIAQHLAVAMNCARSLGNSVAYYFYGYWFSQRRT